MKRLASGEIKVLDYTLDERRHFPHEDKKIMRRKKDNNTKAARAGFCEDGTRLASLGYGLASRIKRRINVPIMMGQDEDTYFGVRVA
jgi:hypothetical protein